MTHLEVMLQNVKKPKVTEIWAMSEIRAITVPRQFFSKCAGKPKKEEYVKKIVDIMPPQSTYQTLPELASVKDRHCGI